jgi:acetyltransferase-like isoleucine patch superfamily enzyme
MAIFTDFIRKIKKRENKFYSGIKDIALVFLCFRIPLFWPLTWVYKGLYYIHIFIRESVVALLKILYFEPMFRARYPKIGVKLRMEKLPYVTGEGEIIIGNNVNISGRIGVAFNDRQDNIPGLVIGDDVFMGHFSSFAVAEKIEIGDNCHISSGVKIFDNDGHPLNPSERKEGFPVTKERIKPVKLCNNVWVGANAIILKGVTIGENSIVGAGAVVTGDLPPNCIAAGNPAVLIRDLK